MSAGNTIMQTVNEMQNIPTDEETLSLANLEPDDPAHEVNSNILNHPLAKALFNDAKFSASRPHLKIPPSLRQQSFTAGTLMGPEMLPVTPLVFATKDGTELVQIQYVGSALCGHPGLVHGGMLATLLDEGLARCCFPGLPNKVGVTASLKVDYRTPCKAGQYVVLRAETTKFEGRKAWVKGRLETLPPDGSQGNLLVEAEALFIEPRNAAILARQRKIVGGDE
jgi:acyl-coenzyme A thioesterase PaaI-like protein